jgi:hypothetical protein
MTRIACKLGLAVAVVLGVFVFTASPAQAHPHGGVIVVGGPRFVVPAYYQPPVVYAVPAPVVVRPIYPTYAVAPVYAPPPVVGAGIRVGPVGIGVGVGGPVSVGVGIGIR